MRDSIKPVMKITRTNAQVSNPGITYDESGVTYDDTNYTYGGVYEHDIIPLVSQALNNKPIFAVNPRNIMPQIIFSGDVSGTAFQPRTLGRGMLIGMLGMTYSEDQTITL